MAIRAQEQEIQKSILKERRKIYRILGLDKNGHRKKTAAERRLEKLLGKGFNTGRTYE